MCRGQYGRVNLLIGGRCGYGVLDVHRQVWRALVMRGIAWQAVHVPEQSDELYPGDIKSVLLSSDDIQAKVAELGAQVGEDYRDVIAENPQDLLLITVLKGAVFFVTDLARAIPLPTQLEFMAVSSYGSSTSSSGVVRILKDLDRDINDRDVLIVEDIVDSGLTLSWLLRNLATRHPRSLRVCTLMRKPDAVRADVDIAYVGFDIPNEFVVGYGLDYAERYRDLPYIGTLDPKVYEQL
jgi:hypoxanthine phosphoribosyltransferase